MGYKNLSVELISGKVRPLGRARIIQFLNSSPSHCSGNNSYQGNMDSLLFKGILNLLPIYSSFPLGFIPLLVPPAAPIPKTRGKSTFSWFSCGINQLIGDEIHPSHSVFPPGSGLGLAGTTSQGIKSLGIAALPKALPEDECRDTGGKHS